jgi:hypothetical protein
VSPDDVTKLVSNIGIPACLLVVIVWSLARVARYWIKPMVERVVNAHLSLVDSLKDTVSKFGGVLNEILENQAAHRLETKSGFEKVENELREIRENGNGGKR